VNLLLQHLVETQPTLTTLEKLQDHSSINQMSVLMHIQTNITRTICNWSLFASLVPVPCLLVSSFKSSFWAYMQN